MEKDYILVVLYENGEKQTFGYDTYEQAQNGAANLWMACGNQIRWTGIMEPFKLHA